jgi:hypothetical protein
MAAGLGYGHVIAELLGMRSHEGIVFTFAAITVLFMTRFIGDLLEP